MEYVRLSDIAEVFSGYAFSTSDMAKDGVPILKIGNIIGDGKISFECESFYNGYFSKKLNKYVYHSDDILVCMTGATIGKIGKSNPDSRVLLVNQRTGIIRNKGRIDNNYLFYSLIGKTFQRYIENVGAGAAQANISAKDIGKFLVPIFSDEQKQVELGNILSVYDNLIEANNKRIKILEQMAENLYKEWFVRFRFPCHETAEFENSRLGKIPKDFRIVKMQDVFDYYVGGGWGNDEEDTEFSKAAYVIRGTDFPAVEKGDLSSCPYRYHKPSNFKSRKLEAEDIILEVSGGTSEQPVGRTSYVDKSLVDRFDGNVICASFCKQIRLKTDIISPIYFYYWMQFLYDTRIIERFQLQSTGIINFKFEYFLKKGDVMLPPKELMKAFTQKALTFRAEIMTLAKQNENLIKQRDLLLPRLMSGKLEVSI